MAKKKKPASSTVTIGGTTFATKPGYPFVKGGTAFPLAKNPTIKIPVVATPEPVDQPAAPVAPQPVTEAITSLQHALGIYLPAQLHTASVATDQIRAVISSG